MLNRKFGGNIIFTLFSLLRFYLEEPPGTQKLYLGRTAPPSKVVHLGDKEQSNWTKEVQGISEL